MSVTMAVMMKVAMRRMTNLCDISTDKVLHDRLVLLLLLTGQGHLMLNCGFDFTSWLMMIHLDRHDTIFQVSIGFPSATAE